METPKTVKFFMERVVLNEIQRYRKISNDVQIFMKDGSCVTFNGYNTNVNFILEYLDTYFKVKNIHPT